MDYSSFYKGQSIRVFLSEQVQKFIGREEKRNQAKIHSTLERLANSGHINNNEKFKHEGNGIWAVKAGQVRVYGWFDDVNGRAFIGAHFIIKKKNKADRVDLEIVKKLRDDFQKGE